MSGKLTRRALMTRIGAAVVAGPAIATAFVRSASADEMERGAFFGAGFGYCDAEVLSQYWQMDIDAAKANAGAKILRGEKKFLRQAIRKANKSFSCSTGINYNDSDGVADLWKSA